MRIAVITVLTMCIAAAPSTRQSHESPQSVQRAYGDAINAQDAPAALALFDIRSPGERATAKIFIANDLAAARLADAAERAYGLELMGGGTLLSPIESESWTVEEDLASLKVRNLSRPLVPPLRKTEAGYRIDLVAWGLNWMDDPDGDAARARHAARGPGLESVRKQVEDGFYRDIEEVKDVTYGLQDVLSLRDKKSSPSTRPRPFRRPVKVDLSSPLETYRSALLAKAEGDGSAWLRCYEIVDPQDRPVLNAYARFITATADIEEAVEERFDPGAKVGVEAPVPHPRTEALSEWSELFMAKESLVVKGDEAVWSEDDEALFELVRIGKEWKLRSRLKSLIGQKEELPSADWAFVYGLIADLQSRFAREINSGTYASPEQAQKAIREASKSAATTRETN